MRIPRSLSFQLSVIALLVLPEVFGCSSRAGQHNGSSATPTPSAVSPSISARFVDVSEKAGIRFVHESSKTSRKYLIETMGYGGAFIDFDGDGLLDVLLLNGRQLPGGTPVKDFSLKLYRNEGHGRFRDVSQGSGLDGKPMYAMGVAVGDFDNDGRDDIYITGALDPSRLYRNMGGGKFQDVTRAAGVSNKGRWGTSAAWVDYDRDGRLDLFVCNYVKYATLKDDQPCFSNNRPVYCIPSAYEKSTCVLYRNLGGGRFKDVSAETGIDQAFGKSLGVTVWDYDRDGWPDIFVANDTVPGFLFHNLGGKRFEEVGLPTGVALSEEGNPHSGMGVDADDVRNDGSTTLAITNYYAQETSLYNQASPAIFRDERTKAGIGGATTTVLGFGVMWLDFDNDGWKDLLQVNGHVQDDIQSREPQTSYAEPTLLFRNRGDGTFAQAGAGEPFSKTIVGRGCAWGDYDNDGRLDALITNNDGPCMLWHNETKSSNHWVTLKVQGTKSNRDGIGAIVTVTAGKTKQRTMLRSGSSYLSASDLRPHFGIGPESRMEVEIAWPSGRIERFANLPIDRISHVREGSGVSP